MASGPTSSKTTEKSGQAGSVDGDGRAPSGRTPVDAQDTRERLERLSALDRRVTELAEAQLKELDDAREMAETLARNGDAAPARRTRLRKPRVRKPRMRRTRVRKPRVRRPRVHTPRVRSPRVQRPRVPQVHMPRPRTTPGARRLALGVAVVAVVGAAGLFAGRWAADEGSQASDATAGVEAASEQYADRFQAEVDSLRADRKAGLEELGAARTPGTQAASLEALAERHSRAAERVRGLDAPAELRGANQFAIAALERVASAYDRLAKAAGNGNAAGYEDGLRAVRQAESRLEERLAPN
jgi:hypothetical protein